MIQRNEGRFRPRRTKFAQVSNVALHDDKLSLKAKGLYSLIQSIITIPGADLRIWKIKLKCKEGSKAFDAAWKELKDTGYLKQYRMPGGAKGAFIYEYDLLEEPDLTTSATINLNKNGEIISITEEIDHTPQDGGVVRKHRMTIPPISDAVLKAPYAFRTLSKRGTVKIILRLIILLLIILNQSVLLTMKD